MKVIKTYDITGANGDIHVLNLCNNEAGSTVVGEIHIQSNSALAFSASVSVDGENWLASKMISMTTYETETSATASGVYLIPTAGYAKVKINFADSGTLTIKEVF